MNMTEQTMVCTICGLLSSDFPASCVGHLILPWTMRNHWREPRGGEVTEIKSRFHEETRQYK